MREILFRGKRLDNAEWVCSGNLIHFHEENAHYIPVANSKCICSHDENDNIIEFNEVMFCKVDPETVGQYTGLTDKNGTKIFEGDIVSTDIARPYCIVEYRDGCFMFNCNDGGEDYYDIMLPILKEPQTQYPYGEVIGNIHDNPERLKGE